jgi:hypothetical protein
LDKFKYQEFLKIENKVLFKFNNSFTVLKDGVFSSEGKFLSFDCFKNFRIKKEKGLLSVSGYYTENEIRIGNILGLSDVEGKTLNVFLRYLYGKRDKEIVKETEKREKFAVQKLKSLDEIEKIISITNKLIKLREEQTKLKSKNELKYRIILNEKLLNNLPNQTYGSVIFYNELNKNSTLFDNSHLNKITRFLNFIETHEDKYLRLYDRCVKLYIGDPNNNCFKELINKLETINHYYEIMKSLINNVNKDKVLYNKLYNLIEDKGVFMTKTEKESLNYMKKVSSGVIELNKNIVNGFNILESQLSDVSSGLYDLDSSLGMVSSSLDDIYMSLPDNRGR